MCLNFPSPVVNPPKSEIGYKCFEAAGDGKVSAIYFCNPRRPLTVGKPQKSKRGPGYHYFTSLRGAFRYAVYARHDTEMILRAPIPVHYRHYAIFECRFSAIKEEGYDGLLNFPARTAKRMTILREIPIEELRERLGPLGKE